MTVASNRTAPVARAESLNQHMTCATFDKRDVPVGAPLYTTPARAVAQDEGAAGEAVAFEIVSYDIYPGACWIAPSAADEYRKEYGCTLRPLYAHPSPTPAADADRVRIAVEALVAAAQECVDLGRSTGTDTPENRERCRAAYRLNQLTTPTAILAALKSTAAKEGGAL